MPNKLKWTMQLKKIGKRQEQTPHQRRYTDGKLAYGKMLNIPQDWGIAN